MTNLVNVLCNTKNINKVNKILTQRKISNKNKKWKSTKKRKLINSLTKDFKINKAKLSQFVLYIYEKKMKKLIKNKRIQRMFMKKQERNLQKLSLQQIKNHICKTRIFHLSTIKKFYHLISNK